MDDAGPDADALFETVHAVMHRFRALQYRARRDDAAALTHMDGKVLGFFGRHPGATQKDLAEHSGRDKGQLARLIAGLRERGLLDARADDGDRRSIRLQLTAAGRAELQAARRRGRRIGQRGLAALSAAEQRQLAALLRKLHDALGDDAA